MNMIINNLRQIILTLYEQISDKIINNIGQIIPRLYGVLANQDQQYFNYSGRITM